MLKAVGAPRPAVKGQDARDIRLQCKNPEPLNSTPIC